MSEVAEWYAAGAAAGFALALCGLVWLRSLLRKHELLPSVAAHFSPKGGCTDVIVAEIGRARREVLVQAYSFSCKSIAGALVAAAKRGVKVHVLLDRSNEKEYYSALGDLTGHGIDVLVDAEHAIAHNKIVVLDRRVVLTGSFNFTRQAELENAENLLVIKGQKDLVEHYRANFLAHHGHSKPASGQPAERPVRLQVG